MHTVAGTELYLLPVLQRYESCNDVTKILLPPIDGHTLPPRDVRPPRSQPHVNTHAILAVAANCT